MTPEFPYVQLPGSLRGFFRKATLWEGADHILSVSGTRFNEEYRRFYYRDIQAIIVEKRARMGSLGLWFILLALALTILMVAVQQSSPYTWGLLLAVLLLLIVRSEICIRRSCRCLVQTAVSREPLPSLIRRSATDHAIARLQVRIAAEQGDLPAEIPQREEDVAAFLQPPDPNALSAATILDQAALRERRRSAERGVNLAIFALFFLLLNALYTFYVSSGQRSMPRAATTWIGYSFVAVGLIPIFLSLQQIGRLPALKSLRVLLVSMVVLSAIRAILSLSLIFATTTLLLGRGTRSLALIERYYVNANGTLQFVVAAAGILLIFVKWDTYRRGEASSS